MKDFNETWLPLISMVLTILGLVFVILQLRRAAKAQESATEWERIRTSQNLTQMALRSDYEDRLRDAGDLGVRILQSEQKSERLTAEDASLIEPNLAVYAVVRSLLNEFETLCSAVNVGAIDWEFAYKMHGLRIRRTYRVFEPFIELVRKTPNAKKAWAELQRLAIRIERKQAEEKSAEEQAYTMSQKIPAPSLSSRQRGASRQST